MPLDQNMHVQFQKHHNTMNFDSKSEMFLLFFQIARRQWWDQKGEITKEKRKKVFCCYPLLSSPSVAACVSWSSRVSETSFKALSEWETIVWTACSSSSSGYIVECLAMMCRSSGESGRRTQDYRDRQGKRGRRFKFKKKKNARAFSDCSRSTFYYLTYMQLKMFMCVQENVTTAP